MSENDVIQINTLNSKKVMWIAIGLGVLAGILNFFALGGFGDPSITVYKVKKDTAIKAGEVFTEDKFDKVQISGDTGTLKQIAITDTNAGAYLNRTLTETVNSGDILLTRSFEYGGEGGIRESISPNERAVPVPVIDKSQDLRPGNVVDIYGNINGKKEAIAKNVCIKTIGNSYLVTNDDVNQQNYKSVIVFVPEVNVSDFLTNISNSEANIEFALAGGKCGDPKRDIVISKSINLADNKLNSKSTSNNVDLESDSAANNKK
jgi:hypothetical protein